jgi:hypothetical protein
MKKLMSLTMLGLFVGSTLVGCKASAEVEGDNDNDRDGKTTIKKTEVQPDGDRKVTKETKTY